MSSVYQVGKIIFYCLIFYLYNKRNREQDNHCNCINKIQTRLIYSTKKLYSPLPFFKVRQFKFDSEIDFEYVFQLMKADGADPNTRDIYGQTIMHEIAREWHADCAKFFSE